MKNSIFSIALATSLAAAALSVPAAAHELKSVEVIGAPGESINPERDLFEATFGTTPGFRMGPNEQLHLILTNAFTSTVTNSNDV